MVMAMIGPVVGAVGKVASSGALTKAVAAGTKAVAAQTTALQTVSATAQAALSAQVALTEMVLGTLKIAAASATAVSVGALIESLQTEGALKVARALIEEYKGTPPKNVTDGALEKAIRDMAKKLNVEIKEKEIPLIFPIIGIVIRGLEIFAKVVPGKGQLPSKL